MTKKFEVTLDCDEDEDEDWQTLRIMRNGEVVRLETDGGEPEDQSFYRDWSWVPDAIRAAYKYGLEDGRAGCGIVLEDETDSVCQLFQGHDDCHYDPKTRTTWTKRE